MGTDENFLVLIDLVQNLVSKVLSIALLVIIVISLFDLVVFLVTEIGSRPLGLFSQRLVEVFGLFLNILIAIELMENITGYLRRHVVQVELVVITSLIAIARKIIIFDSSEGASRDLIALSIAVLALAASYWLIRRTSRQRDRQSAIRRASRRRGPRNH